MQWWVHHHLWVNMHGIVSVTISCHACIYADINECQSNHGCEHSCVNTPGSFRCECRRGFLLNGDAKTCRGIYIVLIHPVYCTILWSGFVALVVVYTHKAMHLHVCDPLPSVWCCIDLDECTGSHRCQHNCHNTVGSYSCSCRTGYQQVGATNCRGEVMQGKSAICMQAGNGATYMCVSCDAVLKPDSLSPFLWLSVFSGHLLYYSV